MRHGFSRFFQIKDADKVLEKFENRSSEIRGELETDATSTENNTTINIL